MEQNESWFKKFFSQPTVLTIDTRPPAETKIINNYYVTINNKIVQMNESEFRHFSKGKKLIKGLENNLLE